MIAANREEYPTFAGYFPQGAFGIAPLSILGGNTLGEVFVDDGQNPRVVLVWTRTDALYLSFREWVSPGLWMPFIWDVVAPRAHHMGIDRLFVQFPDGVENLAQRLQGHVRDARWVGQLHYSFSNNRSIPRVSREGWTLCPIDDVLEKGTDLQGYDELCGWVYSFWPALSDFRKLGTGTCATRDGQVGAWCLTVFAHEGKRELGVATRDAFRKRGLATLVCHDCLDKLAQKGLQPCWSCLAQNQASQALARKLGFHSPRSRQLLFLVPESRQKKPGVVL
ncbi:MAG TPA: GNAT family N-acetyltransferase [Thermotogota bacterium]|nr:GNAT family N-acetyltransferase [Thermotogota bacterium]HRW91989.1 GNAT family N-acetyltransferase [Thermotogota bacterium]